MIERKELLAEIAGCECHVVLCAPSGFGKTEFLAQYRSHNATPLNVVALKAHRGLTSETILNLVAARNAGVAEVLIDDAHLLEEKTVTILLEQPFNEVKIILALRHLSYPKLQLLRQRGSVRVIGADRFTFSSGDIADLIQREHLEEQYAASLGWPQAFAVLTDPYGNITLYLQDLINELPQEVFAKLLSYIGNATDNAFLGGASDELVRELLQFGFPVVPHDHRLRLHPLMCDHLVNNGIDRNAVLELVEDQLAALVSRLPEMTLYERTEAIERFFANQAENEQNVNEKCSVLGSVPASQLSPRLRDQYAAYLYIAKRRDEAQRVLQVQRDLQTATTHTHVLLARIANGDNDFLAMKSQLEMAKTLARTDAERAVFERMQAMYHVRLNDYEAARAIAKSGYEHAVKAGSTDLLIRTLTMLGYVEQMDSKLSAAIEATRKALAFSDAEGDSHRQRSGQILANLVDMLKDAGEHHDALEHIQHGLLMLGRPDIGSAPFLYNTRGLIYSELGRFEEAIEAFSMSIQGFEGDSWLPGLLLPHTYSAYAGYRLGFKDHVDLCARSLETVIERCRARMGEYREHLSYQPLVNALSFRCRGDDDAALAALAEIAYDGRWTYDSVLLAKLLEGEILLTRNNLGARYAAELELLVKNRNTAGNAILVMYREQYRTLLETCAHFLSQTSLVGKVLNAPKPSVNTFSTTSIVLSGLGQLQLKIQGRIVPTKSKYPLHLLAYLAWKDTYVNVRDIGEELFGSGEPEPNKRRQRTYTALNQLRTVLRTFDAELESLLLEEHKELGIRLRKSERLNFKVDFLDYFSNKFEPNAGQEQLLAMLENALPIQAGGSSRFNEQINDLLFTQVCKVATALSTVFSQREPERAIIALLLAIKLTDDDQLWSQVEGLSPRLASAARERVASTMRSWRSGATENVLADEITSAIVACRQPRLNLEEHTIQSTVKI